MVNNDDMKAMRRIKTIHLAAVIFLAAGVSHHLAAQESGVITPASLELIKAKTLWFGTGNSAGLTLDEMQDFNTLLFNYNLQKGDFKRRADGEKERVAGVSTEGGLNLGGGYVWGKFTYNNEKQKGTLFNTTMLDPTRGMPYFPVDANLSDWVKQDYNLSMKAATRPLAEKIFLGIEGEYVTRTGAKQIDPRSTTNFYTLNVKPAMTVKFGTHAAGINFLYERLNQESSTTNSNSQTNQDIFVMRGLGNGYSAVVGGLQSLGKFVYDGNKVGGGLQYSFVSNSVKGLLNVGYTFGVEDVTSTPSKPKKEGTIREDGYNAGLQLLISGENFHRMELSWNKRHAGGIEYVQVLDNSYEVQRWVTTYKSIRSTFDRSLIGLKYDLFIGSDTEYDWKYGMNVSYSSSEDIYIIPASAMKLEELVYGADAKVNLKLKGSNRLLAGVDVSFRSNLGGGYTYGGAEPASSVIVNFMRPDFNYLKDDYVKWGGELSYFTCVSKTGGTGMFLKVSADCFNPYENGDSRSLTSLGLGFTF
jgi:hypothetical protein